MIVSLKHAAFSVVIFGCIGVSCRKDKDDSIIYDIVVVIGQSNNYYGANLNT